ncbi:hypothetical protein [Williamwhitmania taraxaci]|uniref:Uncharacterized protein n=1 Tax=Williamwhitmania taraxaci TaxID=1640674 RepID=A0A1G6MI54_9BACT|nr:hypothetical protein [Williamwhitmania taraxaci]SDC54635.1 hypothetical protein SAMN05216323_10362 [Williamwhitmania taraxaci]
MSRRSIIYIAIAFVVLLLGIGFLFTIFYNSENSGEPIAAIPTDAVVVMRFPSADKLINFQQEIEGVGSIFDEVDWFAEFVRNHKTAKSLALGNDALNTLFTSSNLFVSIHALGKGGNRMGYYIQLPPDLRDHTIASLDAYLIGKGAKMAKGEYQGSTIVHVVPGTGFPFDFYYTICNRLAIISSSRLIVETSIRQLASGESLIRSPAFKSLWNTLGDKSAINIMVNGAKFSSLIQPLLLNSQMRQIKVLNTLTDWIALDGFTRPDALIGNGFSMASDSTNKLFRIFLNQDPQPVTIADALPASVGCFVSYGIADFNDLSSNIKSNLDKDNKLYNHNLRLKVLSNDHRFDIERFFRVAKPAVVTSLFYRNESLENGGCWVNLYTLGDAETARVLAKENFSNYTREVNVSSSAGDVTVGGEKLPIYKLSFTDFSKAIFGNLLFSFDEVAAGFYENYFFTISDPAGAKFFLEAMASPDKLKNSPSYSSISQYAASMGNVFFFFNPAEGKSLLQLLADSPLEKELSKHTCIFDNIGGLGIQLRSLKGKLFTNVFLSTRAGKKDNTTAAEWTFRADTLLASRPFVFKNHKTKAAELAFQDISNKVYLLGIDGSLLWKVQVADRLVGDMLCVDFFKNYKLQLFFTTKNSIYLIDRNGDIVDGFPIALPSPATGPASLFDYDNNGEFRIFVPVADGRVLLFDKNGKEVQGWRFKNTGGLVTTPVNFIGQGAKDYICINDGIRYYFLDRRGKERLKLQKAITPGLNTQCYASDDGNGLVIADKEGNVFKITPDGKVFDLLSASFNKNYQFCYSDITGDKKSEFIFANENELTAFGPGGDKLFTSKLEGSITENPVLFNPGSKGKPLLSVITDEGKAYVIKGDGSVFPGFPMESMFSPTVVKASEKNNIVGALRVTSVGELKYYRIDQ